MLVDKLTVHIKAGKGGDGVVRWRREKSIARGGPYGGDGGQGGNVYFRAVRDVYALNAYDNNKVYSAGDGEPGGTRLREGATGKDLVFAIPVGSIVYNKEYDTTTRFDIEGEERLMLHGGKNGYGNDHFKSSTNRAPYEFTEGTKGESATFTIEVEMIAQVGLIGFPNAGKSSLLNALTQAKAKTANYAFTTLEPNLGDFHGYILADLPGLIEGAAGGKGLGHKFLKHIKRTHMLIHLVSAEEEDVVQSYKTIRKELGEYDTTLLSKKEIIILSKSDTVEESLADKKKKELMTEAGHDVHTLSLFEEAGVKAFADMLFAFLEKNIQKVGREESKKKKMDSEDEYIAEE